MGGMGLSDEFGRFARAHLGDRVLRRVYAVVAADGDAAWTAGEAAAQAKVSHHEADQALRHFAAAGIVARVGSPGGPRRYRWALATGDHAGVGIDGTEPAIDPVCGMAVPAESPHVARDGDREVRFCSLPCLVRWNAGPRPRDVRRPAG